MTMHIDVDILDRVIKITGAKTKTEAVEMATNEMARRHKMKELFIRKRVAGHSVVSEATAL
jgi:hypothetical protein